MAHTQGHHRGQDIDNDYGRFGRLFPNLRGPQFDRTALSKLAKSMIKDDIGKPFNMSDGDENAPAGAWPGLPAAYTYFGQFVDHDITLDLTGLGEQEADDPALENFRSARLDLDCVYGHGIGSSRFFYDTSDYSFQVSGRVISPPTEAQGSVQSKRDLYRSTKGTALIGDHRNDENVIVAQIQQALTQMHNRVIRSNKIIDPTIKDGERFRAAARIVRHHYQWVVLRDYLKRICDPAVYADMVPNGTGTAPSLRYYSAVAAQWPYMPVEFSGAAYRFGHSMVRPSYALNAVIGTTDTVAGKTRIPIFNIGADGQQGTDLGGFKPINLQWGIDWSYLLELPGKAPSGFPKSTDLPFLWQPAYRIDTMLVDPLAQLPDHMSRIDKDERSLAFLNLLRGHMLGLPTAEQMASVMHLPYRGANHFPLMDEDNIWSFGSRFMDPAKIADADERKAVKDKIAERKKIGKLFKGQTPLWFYILREAEFYQTAGSDDLFGGRRLGPMGSMLVLETFLALLWLDEESFLHQTSWRPHLAIRGETEWDKFELKDLLRFALG